MRCIICDRNLNDSESTRRLVRDSSFLDWCNKCYKGMEQEIPTYTREDIDENEDNGDDMELHTPFHPDDEWEDS